MIEKELIKVKEELKKEKNNNKNILSYKYLSNANNINN